MSSFDIATARDKFPALNEAQVYLDNAGGSQTLGTVIDSICSYLSKTNVQLGASYAVGKKSTARYASGYDAAAKYINTSAENIVLGSSTTVLFRTLSFALNIPTGSEIIISKVDHEANISAWVDLAARQNLTVKWWAPKSSTNPKLEASDLKKLLSEKTVLVTCTHASNILGTIHDIAAIAKAVHTVPGAMLCVDAVAYAPHRQVDVKALGVDFYCFSWYKVYGPHMAILYASTIALNQIKSLGHHFNPSSTLENKLGLAGSCYELTAAIPAVLAYFGDNPAESWAAIEKHEASLQGALLDYLNARSDVTIYGEPSADTKKRVSTVSFVVKGRKSQDIVEAVDELTKGEMGIRWGTFYSVRLASETLGLQYDGVVRVSMVHYNTLEEIKQLIGLLDQVLGKV
ncbi:related to selenocysteine lyase [Rhynchosporium secalis]|uniref:Related to selenocysteine lyase n=1 Tax=Rhynchosporium secalis TaxID=38038 RepID=A0A1E1M9C1_RHYSE|nr:related to selenocysteine lyase [Rhynchosporium secalis]